MIGRNNIYVSASRGRRPGVIYYNNSPELLSSLKPEIIYSYEAGVKGSVFGGHLNYDFCTYYYDWYHFQTNRFDQTLSRFIADDAGRAHSFGIEASLAWSPIRQLTLFGNYAYTDGKFNDEDEDGKPQEYAGNRFRLTPKNSFMVGADIEIPVKGSSNFYFRPTYSYKSKVFFEDSNEPELTQDGYGLCNFTAGWTYQPKKVYYEIGIFGKNIFDEKYIVDAGNSGRQIGFPTYVGGTRSVIGIMAKIGF
jgi:outer membrane receptor protein involved in Fe transport